MQGRALWVVSKVETAVCGYYANIKTKPVEWLWYPYIPFGKITVIQGDPGEGKSTVALNLVSRLTRGTPMPDGYPVSEPCTAIYQCAEDGMADTIKPRLVQAGADCEKVAYIIDDDIMLTLEDGRIESSIRETGARVLIVDPLQAFIPSDIDMQNATKMRSILRKLATTAERTRCAIILIGHMNKDSSAKNLYRGLGSIDIAAISRSVLMIARDAERPELRYMYPVKSSLAPEGSAIAFSFQAGGGIVWQGQYELDPLALHNGTTFKTTKQDKARAELLRILEHGARPAKEIFDALAGIGVGSRTVEKVKQEMQIVTYRSGKRWFWTLPKNIENRDG